MAKQYYIKKDPSVDGPNVEWIAINGKEFYQLITSPAGKGRYFIDMDDFMIEANEAEYTDWRRERNHQNYLTCRAKPSGGNKKWSEEELEILKEYYSELGAGVHELLPGRSETACDTMAYRLGISPPDSRKIPVRWTDEEIEVLKTNYHKLGKDVAALLPGRTAASCQLKAYSLGLIYRKYFWSETEDAILKAHYPKEGDRVAQRLPNRTKDSCVTRANQLGLHRLKSTDDAIPRPDATDIREQPAREAAQKPEETPQAQEEESSAFQFGLTQM